MSGFVPNPAEYIETAFQNVQSEGNGGAKFGLAQLWGDFNNITQLLDVGSRDWVGSDPLFTNLYLFQPAAYKGSYLPRNLVKSVTLPHRDLETKSIAFKGMKINYASGASVSDLTLVMYENQQLQTLGYLRSWQSGIVSLAGGEYGLPNDYKYTMFFVYNNSLGNPTQSLAGRLINKLPSGLSSAFNKINFCGLVVLNGCFPKTISYDKHENMESKAMEITATFNVDEMIQMPLGLDFDTILLILGLGKGFLDVGVDAAKGAASQVKSAYNNF